MACISREENVDALHITNGVRVWSNFWIELELEGS